MNDKHQPFMRAALELARRAAAQCEVPIGAVLVDANGQIVGEGHNAPVAGHDPTAHAEVMALRQAAASQRNYRLDGCTLYVTLEPCTMCAGAILHARLARVVYAVPEPRTGAAGSVINPFGEPLLNHQTQVIPAESLGEAGKRWARDCGDLLRGFFRDRRLDAREAQVANHPLRQDALRTAESAFDPWPQWKKGGLHHLSQFISHLPALDGLRLHYLEGSQAQEAAAGASIDSFDWLLLHGHPGWSEGYVETLGQLLQRPTTHRVIVPDLIGFGLSDKPKKASAHSLQWHVQILAELVEDLALGSRGNLIIVGYGLGADLAARLAPVLGARVKGMVRISQHEAQGQMQTPQSSRQGFTADADLLTLLARKSAANVWPASDALGRAPWPDKGHQAAFAAIASWYPEHPEAFAKTTFPLIEWRLQELAHADGKPATAWSKPDDLLAANGKLEQAAAYFGA